MQAALTAFARGWWAIAALLLGSIPAVQAQAAAPSPPRDQAAPQQAATEAPGERVARLARHLLLANVERCPKQRWDFGFYAHRDRAPESVRLAPSRDAPTEPDGFRVITVWPGSPAERSGMRVGDQLLAANAADWADPGFGEVFRRAEQADPDLARITFRIARGDTVLTIGVAGQRACAAYARLVRRGKVNASANATTAFINSGLEQELARDDELSAVIAHEIAHIVLGHAPAMAGDRSARPDRSRIEQDADALGVRLMLAAGIDPAAAARAVATIGEKSRGPISRLLGLYGAYLSTPERQRFLLAEAAAARAEAAAPPASGSPDPR